MLIVNALRYAEHSRAGHYIAGRTNHRFVRYITASTTCKIVVRHWRLEPSTTLITDFTCAFPATGLALRQTCQSGIWKIIGNNSLQRLTWTVGSGNNYGDVCLSSLNSNGLTAQGWVVTGSDACTEDNQTCTVDNVRCYAVRLN